MRQKRLRNFNTLIGYTISALLLGSTPAVALEKEDTAFIKDLVIRHEWYKSNGICVSRPVPLDEKILDIIIVNNIVSFEDYGRWLQKNIKYKRDEAGDRWSTPEETLQNKCADCEDYAFFNEAVLRVLGYQPKVLAMGGLGFHHAICVFEQGGRYCWIDNTELKTTKAESISEFARHLFSKYGASYLLSLNLKARDWDILFKKSEISTQK